jgi:hypothetical protein
MIEKLTSLVEYFKSLYQALFKQQQENADSYQIARHLARVLLYDKKGIDTLYPDVKDKAEQLLRKFPNIKIIETFRNIIVQSNFPDTVLHAPAFISFHQYGLAFDICFKGAVSYPADMKPWKEIGDYAESIGLQWGGNFPKRDIPHFQWIPPGVDSGKFKKYFEII